MELIRRQRIVTYERVLYELESLGKKKGRLLLWWYDRVKGTQQTRFKEG